MFVKFFPFILKCMDFGCCMALDLLICYDIMIAYPLNLPYYFRDDHLMIVSLHPNQLYTSLTHPYASIFILCTLQSVLQYSSEIFVFTEFINSFVTSDSSSSTRSASSNRFYNYSSSKSISLPSPVPSLSFSASHLIYFYLSIDLWIDLLQKID